MAMIPRGGAVTYRGRITECGTCGCQSNLWSSNSSRLEGRLMCPGRAAYPDEHEKLARMLYQLEQDEEDGWFLEKTVMSVQWFRAKFKTIPSDIEAVQDVSP